MSQQGFVENARGAPTWLAIAKTRVSGIGKLVDILEGLKGDREEWSERMLRDISLENRKRRECDVA